MTVPEEDFEEIAARYALEALGGDSEDLQQPDPVAAASQGTVSLDELQGVAAMLSYSVPLPVLCPSLKERLFRQIQSQVDPSPDPKSFHCVRASELTWQTSTVPGIRIAKLHEDWQKREIIGLLQADPGAVYPLHQHVLGEEIYMLEGDLVIEDQVYLAGDFIWSGPGSIHRAHTQGGCKFHFRTSMDDLFLEALPQHGTHA
ncbi:MAG: cupin domain-containing protein [Thermostichus sp. BF3_bins_97]